MMFLMDFGISKPVGKKDKKSKNKKPMNKKKILHISIILSMIVILVAAIVLYTYNDSVRGFFDKYVFRKDVYENELPYIKIDNISAENIYAYGKSILVLEANTLKAYNKMGVLEYSIDVKIKNPLFDSAGSYLCLADKNGKKIYLISGKNIVWQKDLEGEISNISINRNGYIAVSIADTSYKTIVETYNQSRNKII